MLWISLPKAQEILVTVRTVLGECPSAGVEYSYFVHGDNILFRNL